MMKYINKVFALSFSEIYHLIIAFILLIISKILIAVLPLEIIRKIILKNGELSKKTLLLDGDSKYKALAINRIASTLPFLGFTCLPRALAFKYWLKKYSGLELHFGVQKNELNQFVAHAWVSKQNKILLGEDPNINYKSIWVWQ